MRNNITSVVQVLVMLWFRGRETSSKSMLIKHILNHLTVKQKSVIIN